jgi:pimeloyl-ACP methyl ester carboxylesterase
VIELSDQLERGREAYARKAWSEAFAQLSAADAASPLEPKDLELLALAADLIGRDQDSADMWARRGTTRSWPTGCRGGPTLPSSGRCGNWSRLVRRRSHADLQSIGIPVALLWGKRDRMVPHRIGELASSKFGWPLHVVDDAGHVPHIEQPEAFLRALGAAIADP